jgi:hypothetical protein
MLRRDYHQLRPRLGQARVKAELALAAFGHRNLPCHPRELRSYAQNHQEDQGLQSLAREYEDLVLAILVTKGLRKEVWAMCCSGKLRRRRVGG